MLANQEILQFSSANSIIINNEKCRIVQLHEYVVTLQTTNGQSHTATIDLNQFLPVVNETTTSIADLGMTIINDVQGTSDKITEIVTEAVEPIVISEVSEVGEVTNEDAPINDEVVEDTAIRKSKRLSNPRTKKKVKRKSKTTTQKKQKPEVVNSEPKEDINDDNNDAYGCDSDGTVELNESDDEKCDDPSDCDLFLDHEKFAGFPKIVIENSKLIFRGKKLLDLLSRFYRLECDMCTDNQHKYVIVAFCVLAW